MSVLTMSFEDSSFGVFGIVSSFNDRKLGKPSREKVGDIRSVEARLSWFLSSDGSYLAERQKHSISKIMK